LFGYEVHCQHLRSILGPALLERFTITEKYSLRNSALRGCKMPLAPKTNPGITFNTVNLPVNQNEMLLCIVDIVDHGLTFIILLKFGKISHLNGSRTRSLYPASLGVFFVLSSQALFQCCAHWHVPELEQESPQHGLHCLHAHTYTQTLFDSWRSGVGTRLRYSRCGGLSV